MRHSDRLTRIDRLPMGRTYDFIFSIGAACACSSALRRNGLQFASYPFDWVLGPPPDERARMICNGFERWLDEDCLKRLEIDEPGLHIDRDVYRNSLTGVTFIHDFPKGGNLSREIGVVRAKYARRCQRLAERLSTAASILAVYVQSPAERKPSDDVLIQTVETFRGHFAAPVVNLFCLSYEQGLPIERMRREVISNDIVRVSCDYKSLNDGPDENAVEESVVDEVLRREGLAAVDYRKRCEQLAYARRLRQKKFAEFHSKNLPEYFLNRSLYKVYCHLKKVLIRKGFDFS